MRATPFALAFADLARDRFPAIAEVLKRDALSSVDRDRFVLLEPVGRLLREIAPDGTGADALEAHMLMLHHAYRHWAGGGWVYRVSEPLLTRAGTGRAMTSHLPRQSLYLQLPDLKVWGTPTPGGGAGATRRRVRQRDRGERPHRPARDLRDARGSSRVQRRGPRRPR